MHPAPVDSGALVAGTNPHHDFTNPLVFALRAEEFEMLVIFTNIIFTVSNQGFYLPKISIIMAFFIMYLYHIEQMNVK